MTNLFANRLNELIRYTAAMFGYGIDIRKLKSGAFPSHIDDGFVAPFKAVRQHSLLPWEAAHMNYQAAQWIAQQRISGDVVECGVFKGGSIVFFAQVLQSIEKTNRKYWLYDTFEGMSAPTDRDMSALGPASIDYQKSLNKDGTSSWCYETLDDVAKFVKSGAPNIETKYVKGKVEDTLKLPANVPNQISILRLDTDFYESTKAEMEYLYPKLTSGGVLIVDDYTFWRGCKDAVDEYFSRAGIRPALFMDPGSGRVMHFKS